MNYQALTHTHTYMLVYTLGMKGKPNNEAGCEPTICAAVSSVFVSTVMFDTRRLGEYDADRQPAMKQARYCK